MNITGGSVEIDDSEGYVGFLDTSSNKTLVAKLRSDEVNRRWVVVAAMILVVAMAGVLRLAGLWDSGLNSDESVYAGQAAALIGEEPLDSLFSLFRAHPLFLQLMIGGVFKVFGVSDIAARLLVASVFGVGSVILTYLLAAEVYSRKVGLVAAVFLATVPYHVVVSRQVLVDVPMAFFTILSLWLLVVGIRKESQILLLLSVVAAALAVLSKEVAVLLVVVSTLYLVLTGAWRVLRISTVLLSAAIYALLLAPFPISRVVGPSGNASNFILWQFTRAPNHDQDYFLRILLQFAGWPLLILMGVGIVIMLFRRNRGDVLVLVWLGVFMVFFQIWPTKLFFYLIVVVPALAIAAAVGIVSAVRFSLRGRSIRPRARAAILAVVVLALATFGAAVSWNTSVSASAQTPGIGDFDIEVQTFVGTREFAQWANENTPGGSRFLTMGPSLGNILRFYGYRDSVALSVSQDPARRNPAYVPVPNPNLAIRRMAVQYLVWDAYTADRSPFYSNRLLDHVRSFGGIPVYSVVVVDNEVLEIFGPPESGSDVRVIVFDVPGGNPVARPTVEVSL